MASRIYALLKLAKNSGAAIRQFSHLQNQNQFVEITKNGGFLCKNTTSVFQKAKFSDDTIDMREQYVISVNELKEKLPENKVFVIDVRTQQETLDGIIKTQNWVNIPHDEIDGALKLPQKEYFSKYGVEKPNKYSDDIVFYCHGGRRSTIALQTAVEQGFSKARHFPHGWVGWVDNKN